MFSENSDFWENTQGSKKKNNLNVGVFEKIKPLVLLRNGLDCKYSWYFNISQKLYVWKKPSSLVL